MEYTVIEPVKNISTATRRNWKKLNKNLSRAVFSKRANKRQSTKHIIPLEYFSNPSNQKTIERICKNLIERDIEINTCIDSLIVNYLIANKLIRKENGHYLGTNQFITDFVLDLRNLNDDIISIPLPSNENDVLGIIYQCLLLEGEKNIKGSYYTPQKMIREILPGVEIKGESKILDPCCGTGGFLLEFANIPGIKPDQIYGYDVDSNAVKIAKTNLFVKYKKHVFLPNIKCLDFLSENKKECFDYIITNPPWGSMTSQKLLPNFHKIYSNESFSYFIAKGIDSLSNTGELRYILPVSLLNVKIHKDIREYIIRNAYISSIVLYGKSFSGVLTPVISLSITKNKLNADVKIIDKETNTSFSISQLTYKDNKNFVFTVSNAEENKLIKKIYSIAHTTLKGSSFALGIVTGDNKKKLAKEKKDGLEVIFTGREVKKYKLDIPTHFIKYERQQFQQVAKEEFYRAKEKLVYKFISKRLVFAYDDKQNLVLNSANILIPAPNLNIKIVLAFLNSNVLQFIFEKKINQIKVLRNDLLSLPIPILTAEKEDAILDQVDKIIDGQKNDYDLQRLIYSAFHVTKEDIQLIEGITR